MISVFNADSEYELTFRRFITLELVEAKTVGNPITLQIFLNSLMLCSATEVNSSIKTIGGVKFLFWALNSAKKDSTQGKERLSITIHY